MKWNFLNQIYIIGSTKDMNPIFEGSVTFEFW